MTVKDLAPDLMFVSDSQDVGPINEMFGYPEFDSYFVRVEDGDYTEVYGMYGIVPHLSKEVEVMRYRPGAQR